MKKLSLCGRIRRLRYPATPEGRKKYIKDSLDDSFQAYERKEIRYAILSGIVCIVLLVILSLICR